MVKFHENFHPEQRSFHYGLEKRTDCSVWKLSCDYFLLHLFIFVPCCSLRNLSVCYCYHLLANTLVIVVYIFVLVMAKLPKCNWVTRKASQIRVIKSMPFTFLMCPHLESCICLIAVFQRDGTRKGTGKDNRKRVNNLDPSEDPLRGKRQTCIIMSVMEKVIREWLMHCFWQCRPKGVPILSHRELKANFCHAGHNYFVELIPQDVMSSKK